MIEEKGSLNGVISSKETLFGSLNNGIEKVYPELQEKEVTPTGEVQEVKADSGVYGLSKVIVDKINLQDKSVTPTSYQQIVTADSEYSGLDSVTVTGDNNLIPQNIAEGKTIFNVTGTAKVEEEETFDLNTIDPYGIEQVIRDDNYNNGQYSRAIILLMTDTFDNIKLKGASAYKTSDGAFYTGSYSTEIPHTWDKTKDTVNSEGVKTRWVILYNPNTGLYYCNTYYETIAIIFDKEYSVNRYGNSYLSNKTPNVEYIKFINLVNNQDVGFSSAFQNLYELKIIEGTENLILDNCQQAFQNCYSLMSPPKFAGVKENNNGYLAIFNNCIHIKEIPEYLDFSKISAASSSSIRSALYNTSIKNVDIISSNIFKGDSGSVLNQCMSLEKVNKVILPNVKDVSYFFSGCNILKKINQIDFQNANNMSATFSGCYLLEELPYINTSNVTNFYNMLSTCYNLKKVNNLDFISCTNASNMFSQCYSLLNIENISNINVALSFNNCNLLEHNTLIRILNALVDLTGQTSKTLTLGTINKSKLTDEELQIAINKNWSVS